MKKLLKISLQHFAEENTDGAGNMNADGGNAVPTFDEVLKNKDYQSEFDKRITKALETAKAKWETEAEEKLSEAKKLEKMNTEQKAQYEREKQDKALSEREAAVTKRELTATAKETLSEKGLPTELASVLDYSSAENCNKSIETVAKAFETAVTKAVADKLRGVPQKTGQQQKNKTIYKRWFFFGAERGI